ncbi:hypothetical protein D3C85_1488550 [compost metagenome]
MFHQALGHALIVPIQNVYRQQRFRRAAGFGFLACDGRRRADDVLSGVDDVLMTAIVVAEHDLGGARRREFFVELHEIRR